MGSFNVSCGLSNLTIHPEDPVIFIPLRKSNSRDSDEFGNFFVYPNSRYDQCLPSLRGRYYDYGYLTNIEEGMGASLVQEYFHITPEEFIKCIGNNGRSIYSKFGSLAENFPNTLPKDYFLGGDKMGEARHLLTAVGFKESQEAVFTWGRKNEAPYASIAISGEYGEKWLTSSLDDQGNVLWSKEFSSFSWGVDHAMEKATDFLGILPGFQEKHWWAIRALRTMSGMFIHGDVYDQMMGEKLPDEQYWAKRTEETLTAMDKKLQEIDTMAEGVEKITALMKASWDIDTVKQYISLPVEVGYEGLRKHGSASQAVIEMLRLYHVMAATNRMFTPGIDSSEASEDVMEKLILITQGIMQKRRDEMEEWEK